MATDDIDYDLEFLEDGTTIELISIGMVADTGATYYAVSSDAPWGRIRADDWLLRNVVPHLPITGRRSLDTYLAKPSNCFPKPSVELVGPDLSDARVKPRRVIANEVRDFILTQPEPRLWAHCGAYDHVALCQLWGRMIDTPAGIPHFSHDVQQEMDRLGVNDDDLPAQAAGLHDALQDALHQQTVRRWLAARAAA